MTRGQGRGHGTYGYANRTKCDCAKCKAAVKARRQYVKDWKAKQAVKVHGTPYSYELGCRCEDCKLAKVLSVMDARLLKYGITQDQFDAIWKRQDGKCGICRKPLKSNFHIDHDHSTMVVRGLLCFGCNTSIGKLGDTVEALQRALDYVSRTN